MLMPNCLMIVSWLQTLQLSQLSSHNTAYAWTNRKIDILSNNTLKIGIGRNTLFCCVQLFLQEDCNIGRSRNPSLLHLSPLHTSHPSMSRGCGAGRISRVYADRLATFHLALPCCVQLEFASTSLRCIPPSTWRK